MSKIEPLLKRANRLLRSTSTEGLDEEWEMMCSTAKDELLAELDNQIASEGEESPPEDGDPSFLDEPWVAELDAWLEEQAEFNKQQFIKNRGRRRGRR